MLHQLVGMLAGLVLGLFGARTFRLVLFPIVFLVFMVPLPVVPLPAAPFLPEVGFATSLA